MEQKKYKHVYGPVWSWRLGSSLGIDPIFKGRKVCSFDCVYCQIKKAGLLTQQRHRFVSSDDVVNELRRFPVAGKLDFITFSGAGEPTLAENLGEMIKAVKLVRRDKVAVITNSSLIHDKEVRKDLSLADCVVAKLDASRQEIFQSINHPSGSIQLDDIISGLKSFREISKGKLALQIMFVDQNKGFAREIAEIAREINPHEVQINTPLRPCKVKALTPPEMEEIEKAFEGFHVVSVYKAPKKIVEAVSDEETLIRRGKYQNRV